MRKDLNISHDTIKVLQENIGREISDIPAISEQLKIRSNIFTDIFPRGRDIKERINKCSFIKIKCFCTAKEHISKMKREPSVWENIFANDTLGKGLISKIYEEIIRLHSGKTNKSIKKWAKDLNRHFSKEDIQRAQRHMKGSQHHYPLGRFKLKPQ